MALNAASYKLRRRICSRAHWAWDLEIIRQENLELQERRLSHTSDAAWTVAANGACAYPILAETLSQ